MNLNAFAAGHRVALYEDLRAGRPPQEGEFDLTLWHDLRAKGAPQMGATRYEPHHIIFEFIYSSPGQSSGVLTVSISAPERIVMMPVPEWVVESIWQGEISGSHHFESEAMLLLQKYQDSLAPEPNRSAFGPQPAKRRE